MRKSACFAVLWGLSAAVSMAVAAESAPDAVAAKGAPAARTSLIKPAKLWSYEQVKPQAVPAVHNQKWLRSPIEGIEPIRPRV